MLLQFLPLNVNINTCKKICIKLNDLNYFFSFFTFSSMLKSFIFFKKLLLFIKNVITFPSLPPSLSSCLIILFSLKFYFISLLIILIKCLLRFFNNFLFSNNDFFSYYFPIFIAIKLFPLFPVNSSLCTLLT